MEDDDNTYMTFEEGKSASGVTKVIILKAKLSQAKLGEIKWFGPWRKYCFFPDYNMIFDNVCLEIIGKKLERLMQERKNGR